MTFVIPKFFYTQGYDRFVLISHLLGLDFCGQTSLSADFAEAMSFFLGAQFIRLVNIAGFLDNPAATEVHFRRMDADMMTYAPNVMIPLRRISQGSIHFALRWELLLFADEYHARPMLLLWDQVLVRRKDFDAFLYALCVAHARQVPPAGPDETVIEKIQNWKEWDVMKIVADADTLMHQMRPLAGGLGVRDLVVAFVLALIMLFIGLFVLK
jgi:hypothetical protein